MLEDGFCTSNGMISTETTSSVVVNTVSESHGFVGFTSSLPRQLNLLEKRMFDSLASWLIDIYKVRRIHGDMAVYVRPISFRIMEFCSVVEQKIRYSKGNIFREMRSYRI